MFAAFLRVIIRAALSWVAFVAAVGGARAQDATVVIAEQPADAVTNVGGVAAFKVVATGAPPLAFAWFRDGQALANATTAILVLDAVTTEDTGSYQVRVTDARSAVSSHPARLTVDPPPVRPIVDPTFQGDARLNTVPTTVLPLPSGEVIAAPALDGRIVRLLPDGHIDPSFVSGWIEPPFGLSTDVSIHQLLAQPDGRLLVVGNFIAFEGRAAPGLLRLKRDGTRDETFTPPGDLELLNLASGEVSRRVALQSDGKLLVLSSRGLVRLLPDGGLDASFAPAAGANANIAAFALAGGDRIYVGLAREQVVARLLSDGSEDPAFARRAADVEPAMRLHVLADGRLIVNGVRTVPARPVSRRLWTLARWLDDGTPDPSLPVLDVPLAAAPAPDGTLYLPDRSLLAPDGTRSTIAFGLGQFDSPVATNGYPVVFGPDGRIYLYGSFAFHNGVNSARVVRLNRVPAGTREVDAPPRILAAWSQAPTLTLGEATTLRVAAVAPGPVTYEWRHLNRDFSLGETHRTSAPYYRFAPRYGTESGNWNVRVLNAAGEAISAPIVVTLRPAVLRIEAQPTAVMLAPGRSGSLHVRLSAYSEMSRAEWRRDGVVTARYPNQDTAAPRTLWDGATDLWLELGAVTELQAGTYVVTVAGPDGREVTSQPIVVTVADTPRFVNLSTRGFVGAGEQAMVLGFVIPPGASRVLVARGIGPTLAAFGVTGALAAARLELFDQSGRRMGANDRWREFGGTPSGAFALPPDSSDAMLINGGLPPGAYTVRLSGPPGVTGVGLIELYEGDVVSDRFVNISTRVMVNAAASPAIAGFAIRGARAKRVLVRAAGPALQNFGVTRPLWNPRLEVRDERGGSVAANGDGWEQGGAGAMGQAAAAVGAFGFAAGSRDAALLLDLPPGNFTALVAGGNADDEGIALLEIYEVP